MREVKLKPCPFCGSKAKIKLAPNPYGGGLVYSICCKSETCKVLPNTHYSKYSEVAAAWNKRVCQCNKEEMGVSK